MARIEVEVTYKMNKSIPPLVDTLEGILGKRACMGGYNFTTGDSYLIFEYHREAHAIGAAEVLLSNMRGIEVFLTPVEG